MVRLFTLIQAILINKPKLPKLPAVAVQRDHHRWEHIMVGSKCIHTQEGGLIVHHSENDDGHLVELYCADLMTGGDAESVLIGCIHSQWPGSVEIVLDINLAYWTIFPTLDFVSCFFTWGSIMSKQTPGKSDELLPFPFKVARLSIFATLFKIKLKRFG
jgi:hypothetical protein